MSHTPTPWNISGNHYDDEGYPETVISAINGAASVAVTLEFGSNNPLMREANARRIVACVNACAGIDTDILEKTGKVLQSCFDDLSDSCSKFESERDTFRDLCGELLFALTLHQQVTRPIDLSTKVIAKAEAVMGDNHEHKN